MPGMSSEGFPFSPDQHPSRSSSWRKASLVLNSTKVDEGRFWVLQRFYSYCFFENPFIDPGDLEFTLPAKIDGAGGIGKIEPPIRQGKPCAVPLDDCLFGAGLIFYDDFKVLISAPNDAEALTFSLLAARMTGGLPGPNGDRRFDGLNQVQ